MAQTDRLNKANELENDVTATTSSGSTPVLYASIGKQSVEIKNIGTADVFFRSGGADVSVSVATGCCVPYGQTLVYAIEPSDLYFAVCTEASTTRVRIKGGIGI